MKTQRVEVSEFENKVKEVTEQSDAVFVYFFGTEDPSTGKLWCPDCVRADPVIRKTLDKESPHGLLLECPVGSRTEWKGNASHPYRTNPQTKLTAIPTLMRWTLAKWAFE
ncbi:hypothetical protein BZG36_04870 [Bifiguratus adelaidae]|uniref:Thioredoxin domain-containing protein n=1 Tax=Bifiguratus adelaidae TaxID=1938954 RepID=A0A261XUL1_9FUNG|nr:hypothetical protein BZG36_04870 [Bifiguratus adelaidae]